MCSLCVFWAYIKSFVQSWDVLAVMPNFQVKQDTEELRVMYREGPEGTPFHTLLAEGYVDGPVDVCKLAHKLSSNTLWFSLRTETSRGDYILCSCSLWTAFFVSNRFMHFIRRWPLQEMVSEKVDCVTSFFWSILDFLWYEFHIGSTWKCGMTYIRWLDSNWVCNIQLKNVLFLFVCWCYFVAGSVISLVLD